MGETGNTTAGAVTHPFAGLAATTAIISGSGLAAIPDGVAIVGEIGYERLGWPVTAVTGHPSRVLVGRWTAASRRPTDAHDRPPMGRADDPIILLCCGRPHSYEGWSDCELRRPVDDLADWGVTRLVATNASGSLGAGVGPGDAVVVDEIIDLQRAPHDSPPHITATSRRLVEAACAALAPHVPVRRGRYVAVAGPTYETPAQALWLAGFADVVGMSTAPEADAARRRGLEACVISLAVNRSGASLAHDEVLTAGARLEQTLRPALAALLAACWPETFAREPARRPAAAPAGSPSRTGTDDPSQTPHEG